MRVLILIAFMLLAGCGQKGQLFLPGPSQTEISVPEAEESAALQPESAGEADETEAKKDKKD